MPLEIQTESGTVEVQYGDQFRHQVTGDIKTVHDIRDGSEKVVWADGTWDYREDIEEAVRGEHWAYEVHQLGQQTFMPEEYLSGV